MTEARRKAEQIISYYIFHKKIELIFTKGKNHLYEYLSKNFLIKFFSNDDINLKQEFHVIEEDFIKGWKTYVNYEAAKKYLDTIDVFKYNNENEYMNEIKEMCENMILTGEINNNNENKPIIYFNNGIFCRNFIHKLVLDLNYLDPLVDGNIYGLFKSSYEIVGKEGYEIIDKNGKKESKINGLLLDKIIVLCVRNERKMKFLLSHNKNIIQLTADFNIENIIDLHNFTTDKSFATFDEYYYSKLLKQKSDDIIIELFQQGIPDLNSITIKAIKGGNIFKLYNDTIFKDKKVVAQDLRKINFNNINLAKFNGLANIGATCYMNATLQNLINTDLLTRYLLNQKNFNLINSNINTFELTSKYVEVLINTVLNDNNKTYYEPYNFKEIISRKNPLFAGVQANDSKDLINFLLEEMHTELKMLENNINQNTYESFLPIQNNQFLVLNNFKKVMSESNKSIISKLFYILVESMTHCQGCNNNIYNYEVTFYIEFPLENVYNFCIKNGIPVLNQNKINIPLIQCFNNYNQPSLFTGENQIYCNYCKCQQNATYVNNFFSFPPILIIILNRGKGNQFNCDVDFNLDLNLKNYCKNYDGNVNYKLKGVITHLGESGMGGHFIAYCRHRITNEWYCYNDAVVSKLDDQINGYKKGSPYILFYEGQNNCNNFIYPDNNFNQNFNMNNNTINFQNQNNNNNFNNMNMINCMNNNNNFIQNFNFMNNNMLMNNNINNISTNNNMNGLNMNNNFNNNISNTMNNNFNNNMNNIMNNNFNNNNNMNMNNTMVNNNMINNNINNNMHMYNTMVNNNMINNNINNNMHMHNTMINNNMNMNNNQNMNNFNMNNNFNSNM